MNTLYSFRRCPYAMRARMALRYSNVPVEIIEVSLKGQAGRNAGDLAQGHGAGAGCRWAGD